MKRLRVAIIGQGRSGRSIHAGHIQALPRMYEIVACVDPWKVRRDHAAEDYGCDVYRDYKPLLKRDDIDFVVNGTPSHLRVPVALDLFRAGHNVLCEKPLAKTVKDVDRIIAAAKKAGARFAIYQQSRFAPYFLQVRKVIDSGVLGRIVQISINFNGFSRRWDWQTLTAWDGGNLLNTGPHPLDQALRLMDVPLDQVPEVFCHMDNTHFYGDAEGHVSLSMRYPDRPFINLEICSDCAYPAFTYQVYGTKGGMRATTQDAAWRYYNPRTAPKHRVTTRPIVQADGWSPAYCREDLKFTEKKWTLPKRQGNLFHTIGTRFYRMWYKHMTEGAPLEITPEQVRQQIAVIEEAHRQNPHIWGPKPKKKPRARKKAAKKD